MINRDDYAGRSCSIIIDGKKYPARIIGSRCRFMNVAATVAPFTAAEYSDAAIKRVMDTDQTFKY